MAYLEIELEETSELSSGHVAYVKGLHTGNGKVVSDCND